VGNYVEKPWKAMKSARKRVLFLMPNLSGGGAERVIVTLLRHLDRSRFEPHLALVEVAGPYLKEVPADVPLHDLKAKRVRHAFPGIIRLSWKLRPHAIHSTLCEMNMATALLRPFLPPGVRLLIREGSSPSAQNVYLRKHPLVWKWLYRWLYPRADKIICVGDFVADDLANKFRVPRRKLVRIYNPVDIELGRKLANATGNPYEGNGPHLVGAGRLSKEKGFDVLLDAMPRVRAAMPDAHLTILGEGGLKPDLLAQRERLGLNEVVHLIGFQHDPYPYLKHADLLVLPSRFEGMPVVVIEALGVGTPVVASDCPGAVREILGDCTIARLVPPSDPKALAETIVSALNSADRALQPDEKLDAFLSRFEVKARVRDYEEILGT
jgi:glycosyltransferase involved in cell wall biosynthesis